MSKTILDHYKRKTSVLESLCDQRDDFQRRAENVCAHINLIEKEMIMLEELWLENHDCSCELLGVECHGHTPQ